MSNNCMEYPFILGSAGHIDHGKTTLVRALTGVDCDRLSEEKKRGITIELGFAPLTLPSGRVVSIIDVPGHEKFIRQMAAGATGIDAAMLVVAADEGVMPQTREHLDILALLGVSSGLVALNKIDLVDDETLELAQLDVDMLTQGTFLEGAPVLPVSSVGGDGIPALLEALEKLVANTPARNRRGAFFMPIDRAFSMRGFGSVVTGTSYHGVLREGDEVEIMPSGLRAKARSIQVHGASAAEAVAGHRTAVNLASISLEQLVRGSVVCAPGRFTASRCLDARLEVLPAAPEPITHWQRLRLHIGTSDVVVRVSMLAASADAKKRRISPGESGLVQLLPESAIAAAMGERFVVRFYSPLRTIGGGEILLPNTSRPRNREERASREDILQELDAAKDLAPARLRALIRERGILEEKELFKLSQMEKADFDEAAEALDDKQENRKTFSFGASRRLFCSEAVGEAMLARLTNRLSAFHKEHPELAGQSADELLRTSRLARGKAFELRDMNELLALFIGRGRLKSAGSGAETRFHLPGFKPRGDDLFMEMVKKANDLIITKGFCLAEIASLPRETGIPAEEAGRVIGFLKENNDLKIIGDGLLLPKETRSKLHEILGAIGDNLTVAALRDTIGTNRKHALAVLEFFDSQGVTRRVGDKRVMLKTKP